MAPTLPADIQQVLDEIDDSDRAADVLVANLSDTQFHWQPHAGRSWSIAQCLEHLATINVVYGGALRGGVEQARQKGWTRTGALKPGFFGQKFIESQEPPVKRRVRAPGKVRPGSQLTRDEILRRYHTAHEDVKRVIQDAATIDANRATFPNPFLKIIDRKS